jgi:hypothetical protein
MEAQTNLVTVRLSFHLAGRYRLVQRIKYLMRPILGGGHISDCAGPIAQRGRWLRCIGPAVKRRGLQIADGIARRSDVVAMALAPVAVLSGGSLESAPVLQVHA